MYQPWSLLSASDKNMIMLFGNYNIIINILMHVDYTKSSKHHLYVFWSLIFKTIAIVKIPCEL